MIIVDQTIPPALATAYRRLIANGPVGAGGRIVARTTKKARASAPIRMKRKQLRDIEEAVDMLIAYLTIKNGQAPAAGFRAEQITALKIAEFNPAYWTQCSQTDIASVASTPTSAAWVGPRNYAYPDPANQPSVPTYGDGAVTAGEPTYTGSTTGGMFRDTYLRWSRVIFALKNKITAGVPEPLFVKITGSITASSNSRPSRAMMSAIIKRWMVKAGSARPATLEAPVTKPLQALYRYKTLRGAAPYFNLVHNIQLMYQMRSTKYEEIGGECTQIVMLYAPMPMMGKRYNNNTAVTVTSAVAIEMWQIKKQQFATLDQYNKGSMITLSNGNLTATAADGMVASTIGKSSGKWYWECTINQYNDSENDLTVGVATEPFDLEGAVGINETGFAWLQSPYQSPQHKKYNSDSPADYGSADIITNTIIGIALDMDGGTIEFYVDGVAQGIAFTGLSGFFSAAVGARSVNTPDTIITANFGASAFAHTVPVGYNAGIYE